MQKQSNKKFWFVVIAIILLLSIICNIFLYLLLHANNNDYQISGTYQVSNSPEKTEYLAISKEKGNKYDVYSYVQGEDYVSGEITKLKANIYMLKLHDNKESYYIFNSKDELELIIKDKVISYKKVSNHLEFIGKHFK